METKNYPKVAAVDFDGTLCYEKYPEIGEPIRDTINRVKSLKEQGWQLILWTNREGELLDDALRWCEAQGIEFDAINENLPWRTALYGNDCRKIGADIYIDDKAINPNYEPSRLCMMIGDNKKPAYVPTCPKGYSDCVHDPAYIKFHYPEWYSSLYGDVPPDVAAEVCREKVRDYPHLNTCYDDTE